MKYLPLMGICVALVFVMAGWGTQGRRAGESVLLVVAAFLVLAAIFGFVLARR